MDIPIDKLPKTKQFVSFIEQSFEKLMDLLVKNKKFLKIEKIKSARFSSLILEIKALSDAQAVTNQLLEELIKAIEGSKKD